MNIFNKKAALQMSQIQLWVDFINHFVPLRQTFAPYAELLRRKIASQKLGVGWKSWLYKIDPW